MTDVRQDYIALIKKRSEENRESLELLFQQKLFGNCIAILRQELDSFVRILYLGRIPDARERERLIHQTLSGQKWTLLTANNKMRQVTDREMIEKATELKGYVHYVYKFGCGFIHLSDLHNYANSNPFDKLDYAQQFDIKLYLHQYHGFPRSHELAVETISYLLPAVFKKISENMVYYFGPILHDTMIEL